MSLSNIRSLEDNQIVRYRIGRAGAGSVTWDPWTSGPLFVKKRLVDLRKSSRHPHHTEWQAGAVITLTPRNSNTAEYSEADYDPTFDCFTCEDYTFQIDWTS